LLPPRRGAEALVISITSLIIGIALGIVLGAVLLGFLGAIPEWQERRAKRWAAKLRRKRRQDAER
jgi:hypothetical protein